MKNWIKLAVVSSMVLFFVPQVFAQAPKKPVAPAQAKALAAATKTKAQIAKFEEENLRLIVAHINSNKKDRIKVVTAVADEKIKAAKEKSKLQKNFNRGAGLEVGQKLQAQIQEIDAKVTQTEKSMNDQLQEKQKKQNEEFQQNMKKRRDDFF